MISEAHLYKTSINSFGSSTTTTYKCMLKLTAKYASNLDSQISDNYIHPYSSVWISTSVISSGVPLLPDFEANGSQGGYARLNSRFAKSYSNKWIYGIAAAVSDPA